VVSTNTCKGEEAMSKQSALYIRKGSNILSIERKEDGSHKEVLTFDSINQAKKKSREIQLAHGGLGRGSVMRGD